MATPQRSCTFSLRRRRASEKDSPAVDTVTIDAADFHAYTAGDRGQYFRGSPPLPFSIEFAAELTTEFSTESPITPPIGTPT